ncbi:alpha/beta hydrolase [Paenibacillus sp. JX-17]|uniref:Alpha/beta hydrolase n=1 Tax=Paenibacillus lacisoli TaxID=3064525 RepID=A0ABT9CFS9_9BACL|nr:alpha/beta hydrolase [Paenibacillus sp. JX-17]MDO7908132.1 alpha/beta hydrolase [Paenibacillus sp. JX-17]
MRRKNKYKLSFGSRKKKRWPKIVLSVILLIVLAGGVAVWRYLIPYEPQQEAAAAMSASTTAPVVKVTKEWIDFVPEQIQGPGVIFYPGALVKPESYAPMARDLALQGHHVVIVKMPLNLAVLGSKRADDVLKAYPNETFVIGGHSLGGAMAARYTAGHASQLKGVFFLGAYPDEKGSLKSSGLPALSILGSKDEVVDTAKYKQGHSYLPEDAVYKLIEGGNHAQFGDYGIQKGDGKPGISEDEQRKQTVQSLLNWLKNIKG